MAEELVERCDGLEVDGLTFSLAHVWRGEAVLRIAGGADERVTDTDAFFRDLASGAAAAAARARGRAHGARLRGVDARGHAPARGRAAQRDHAQVVGPAAARAELPRAPRPQRRVLGRLGVPARARDSRSASRRSTRRRPTTRPPTCAAARRWRGERLDAGDTFVFCHQKATDAAGHTKDPHVKRDTIEALDAALGDLPTRPRDRLHHRRPRDAGLAGRDPLGRPGAAPRRGPGRARRRASSASASSTAPPGSSASCAGRT